MTVVLSMLYQSQLEATEETKQHLSDSWQFSANQLVLAEQEIEDSHRAIEELNAEIRDRDEELDVLDRDLDELQRGALLAEKARREQFGECSKELRAAERDAIRREKKFRERQQEFEEIKAAIAQAASHRNGNDVNSPASKQQQYREERLCLLVEKLLGDVERCGGELERKNAVLRTVGEHIASTAAALAAPLASGISATDNSII